jgi:hypothetical protein
VDHTPTLLHFFPIRVEVGWNISGMALALLPWSGLASYSLVDTDADGAPLLVVGLEWPLSWLRTVDPLEKFHLEYLHLRRFSADQALATGHHAFGDVQPGSDPPDAIAQTVTGVVGVEATALTIQNRRWAHNLFAQLRQALQAAEPSAFAKLRGHLLYVWFQETAEPGPPVEPHGRSDAAALDDLVRAIAEYDSPPDALRHEGGPAPETLPEIPLAGTGAGAKFYGVPILDGVPGSMLFTLAGFDIGLAYTTPITAEAAWQEVQRLVDKHDQPDVDLLLITAGGPDARGNMFPAEEAVAGFLLEHAVGLSREPEHIRQIVLHSWATGQATTLYPKVQHLFGPLYTSMVPLHHPFQAGDQPAADGDATETAE